MNACQQCITNTTVCMSQENTCNNDPNCAAYTNCIDNGMAQVLCQQMYPQGMTEYAAVLMCLCQQSVCGAVCAGQGC